MRSYRLNLHRLWLYPSLDGIENEIVSKEFSFIVHHLASQRIRNAMTKIFKSYLSPDFPEVKCESLEEIRTAAIKRK